MVEPRRLHPAAILVYSASALRGFAFPLVIVIGMSLIGGGGIDVHDLVRSIGWGLIGLVISFASGFLRWRTSTYWIEGDAIHHHSGLLRTRDTKVPLERIEALDVHQGPLQRWFNVLAVEVQTGAATKGGEISLPALRPDEVEALRQARPGAAAAATSEEPGPQRRLEGRDLAIAALTAGQLGLVLPVLAAAGQVLQQVANPRRGREAEHLIPHSFTAIGLIVLGLIVLAWVLSTLGSVVAFAGFTITRDDDRLRIRRGLVQRREATVPVHRVRAVRVVEGIFRRPFGLASIAVEVTGYAEEPSAARTLFPLVRLRDVPAFLAEILPELADDPRGLERPPTRAARRYLLLPTLAGLLVGIAAYFLVGVFSVAALVLGLLYGWARWRAAGWRLQDGRLATRSMRFAATTVLAPAHLGESHTVAQNVFQRRADLADLSVAFGKSTTAKIRHIEARAASEAWAAL